MSLVASMPTVRPPAGVPLRHTHAPCTYCNTVNAGALLGCLGAAPSHARRRFQPMPCAAPIELPRTPPSRAVCPGRRRCAQTPRTSYASEPAACEAASTALEMVRACLWVVVQEDTARSRAGRHGRRSSRCGRSCIRSRSRAAAPTSLPCRDRAESACEQEQKHRAVGQLS